jgi:NADPH:quinone reductase-like Zn-dependent oxidoreductase
MPDTTTVQEPSQRPLNGKVALVTGAGGGIGRAAALLFAHEGAKVVIGNRDEKAGAETVAQIEAKGGTAAFQRTDIPRPGDAQALVAFAVKKFGGLHIAFNNAGTEGRGGLIVESKEGSRWAASALSRRSRGRRCSLRPTTPRSSPARPSRSTAALACDAPGGSDTNRPPDQATIWRPRVSRRAA